MKKWKTTSGYEVIRLMAGRSNVFVVRSGTKNLMVATSVSRLRKKPIKRLASMGIKTIDYLVHTPGHTAGSVSLIVDDELALTGDTLFGVFRWSVYPPYASDAETMVRSWGKLLETKCSLFLPSHGTPIRRSLLKKDYDKRI